MYVKGKEYSNYYDSIPTTIEYIHHKMLGLHRSMKEGVNTFAN